MRCTCRAVSSGASIVCIPCMLCMSCTLGACAEPSQGRRSCLRTDFGPIALRSHCSGECEEQLLQRRQVGGSCLLGLSNALAQAARDDREPGPVQRLGDGSEKRDDVLAVTAFLEHPDHATQLALGPAEAVEDRGGVVGIELHGISRSSSWEGVGGSAHAANEVSVASARPSRAAASSATGPSSGLPAASTIIRGSTACT